MYKSCVSVSVFMLLYIPRYGVRFLPCVRVWLLLNCNGAKFPESLLYVLVSQIPTTVRVAAFGHREMILNPRSLSAVVFVEPLLPSCATVNGQVSGRRDRLTRPFRARMLCVSTHRIFWDGSNHYIGDTIIRPQL